ncbi:MAG: NAD-binding protein [Firmicutes bacterium]|nr:NAD-binding protein [Bacillota bacterium]
MKKTGFIGLGIMGRPMASNLVKAGCDLIVYDLNEEAVRALTALGAKAGTPDSIGRDCDVIFLSLPNGSISQSVLFGEGGVCSKIVPGAIVCDTSSVTPSEAQTCHEKLLEHGVFFVDSPVSGGEPGAIAGTLAFMAGGEQEAFNELKEYFDIMGSSAVLIGGSGMGCVTKLANQVIVNLTIAAVSEAFVLSTKAGADPIKVYDAIRGGLAGSAVLDAKIPMIVERNFKPGGKISINHKDIKNVLATAHEIDVPVPFSAQLFEIQQALKAHGHMDDDHCGYVQYFEALAGVTVQSKEK